MAKNISKIIIIIVLYIISNLSLHSESKHNVRLGIDNLIKSNFEVLAGKRVILYTNQSGRTSEGTLTAEIFAEQNKFLTLAFFTPEHGLYSTVPAGEEIANDKIFDIPIISLYGGSKKPTAKQLENCDAVVVDIQDIGVRSYTYISTLYYIMEACAEQNVEVVILDRPNPIGGLIVDGNVVEEQFKSFIGIIPVPYLHGCTIGEIAKLINGEGWLKKDGKPIKAKLNVIKMSGWQRWMSWEDTGFSWIPTSPHIPSVDAARGYATLGSFGELGVISIGIGTTLPFQYIGSPEFNTDDVYKSFKNNKIDGLDLIPTRYRPFYAKYSNTDCNGFLLRFKLNNHYEPYTAGFRIMLAIREIHPEIFDINTVNEKAKQMFCKATGTDELFYALFDLNATDEKVLQICNKGKKEFLLKRAKYLLYE
ncbi:MAG TPA: DUF1343 domain-containing protein [Candidatus Kapabacteria bacterium]|nr:DUF1343 domain-containing protein [Candidatus Kapabacteria bacterium]HPO62916.1 DUF1343 domain-containing protein [Candidatus Kapabacteria bacterium]